MGENAQKTRSQGLPLASPRKLLKRCKFWINSPGGERLFLLAYSVVYKDSDLWRVGLVVSSRVLNEKKSFVFCIATKVYSVVPAIVVNCVLHIIQLISNPLSETLWSNRGGNSTNTMENDLRNSRSSAQHKMHIKHRILQRVN